MLSPSKTIGIAVAAFRVYIQDVLHICMSPTLARTTAPRNEEMVQCLLPHTMVAIFVLATV